MFTVNKNWQISENFYPVNQTLIYIHLYTTPTAGTSHNLYRMFARDMDRYAHRSDQRIYQEFIKNAADIKIQGQTIVIQLKKKRSLLLIIEKLEQFKELKYPWMKNKKIQFVGASYS